MVTDNKFLLKKHYDFGDFVEIIHKLRAPGGCPWDREQTHASLKKSFIEETYEALETIDNGDMSGLCEELGDVLLQILLHAEIEAENGTFDINDVVDGIAKKMIYRHPHVFGDVKAETADKVLDNWEILKKAEKHRESDSEVLAGVSRALPALMRAQKVQHKAAKAGMDFDGYASAKQRLLSEIEELDAALANGGDVRDEVGDVLFSAVNLARFAKVESEEALTASTDKFISRFTAAEKLANERGMKISQVPPDEADKLWQDAKKVSDSGNELK